MKKHLSSLVFILIAQSGTHAANPVEFSPVIQSFKDGFIGGKSDWFRSSAELPALALFSDADLSPDFPAGFDKAETGKDAEYWRHGLGEEYTVRFAEDQAALGNWLNQEFKPFGFVSKFYDLSDSCHVFSYSQDSLNRFKGIYEESSKNFILGLAMQKARSILKSFKGQIEYENVETEYTDGKISSLSVRFRRIFKNALVRANLSYIYLTVDGQGKTREVRIKWPLFDKQRGSFEVVSMDKALVYAREQMANMPDVKDDQGVFHPKKAKATSMALAWVPVEESGNIILAPGISLIAEVSYGNGDVLHPPIDAPLLKKYYESK